MNSSISITTFNETDTSSVLELFYDTVHTTGKNQYTQEQLNAWAPSKTLNMESWKERFLASQTLVAKNGSTIVGFGNLENQGTSIDMVYVHKDWQRKGIATALLEKLEAILIQNGLFEANVEVSLMARPFFEHMGYRWIMDNRKMKNGVELFNFVMKKELNPEQTS